MESRVLVVGGGVAGLTSSLSLAAQGMPVVLVEKEARLGGNAAHSHFTLKGSEPQQLVSSLVAEAEKDPRIEILKPATLSRMEGRWGDLRSTVCVEGQEKEIAHGAVIFATGAQPVVPDEYLYGQHPNVITQRSFEELLAQGDGKVSDAKTVVMIQCVGSREPGRAYCSRVCCTHAIKNALKLKEVNPDVGVYVLNRDVRAHGFYEKAYQTARDKGVVFVRYEVSTKPSVSDNRGEVTVSFLDGVARETLSVNADLLVLSSGMETAGTEELAKVAGLQVDEDGFFSEANPKAAPLDSVDRGKYICGLCHSPNHIEDVLCQAKAAAARASTLLWHGFERYAENQAYVIERVCCGCAQCVSACPYDARVVDEVSNTAQVIEDLCKGCGTCVISCPNGASQQRNFEKRTMLEVLDDVLT